MSAGAAKGETRIEEPTSAERTVARRSAEARATVPDLELHADVDMEACLRLRDRDGSSITAMLVRASALALRGVPRANGAYRDGHFELYSRVNVGLVAAAEHAYVIPTVFDADAKSPAELTGEIEELLGRARDGELPPPAFSGATFTLWDLSSSRLTGSSIVVNPPQAAALAAGGMREVPAVRDGAIVPGHALALTLVCDHRILYGATAIRFLTEIQSALERAAL